jgi:hypothetical protein
MMESSSLLLQQLLKDLSPHERRDAVTMFAVIGMESYLQRHLEDINLSGSMVKIEHGMYNILCFSFLFCLYSPVNVMCVMDLYSK